MRDATLDRAGQLLLLATSRLHHIPIRADIHLTLHHGCTAIRHLGGIISRAFTWAASSCQAYLLQAEGNCALRPQQSAPGIRSTLVSPIAAKSFITYHDCWNVTNPQQTSETGDGHE